MPLRDHLTTREPLGPARHDQIAARSDHPELRGTFNTLVYKSDLFDNILGEVHPIIMGRRGSGKTALISAIISKYQKGRYYYSSDTLSTYENGDVYLFIQSMDHLDDLVNNVGLDCAYALGAHLPSVNIDWEELAAETAARHWERRLWNAIFQQIYSSENEGDYTSSLRAKLPLVFKLVEGSDILLPHSEITNASLDKAHSEAKQSVLNYLQIENKKCFIVIDSIDRYPVTASRFSRLIAGLLRCITNFSDKYNNIVNLYCCFPEEIEGHIRSNCANEHRDLSLLSNLTKLHWSPNDLKRIIAERYRAFLDIHLENDEEFLKKIRDLDFQRNEEVRSFFRLVLPDSVKNRFGQNEDTFAYLTRHTQLLPREMIMLFSDAIKRSHKISGSWRYIQEQAIIEAISTQERTLCDEVMNPFQSVYNDLLAAAKKVLPSLSPICSLGDLDKAASRIPKHIRDQYVDIWSVLFEIGIIGYIDPTENSDYYEYGVFQFNSNKPFVLENHMKYCIHPMFSGTFHLQRKENMKFIYPAGLNDDT